MSQPPVDKDRLLEALETLRDARDPAAPAVGWAWRTVDTWIDRRLRLRDDEHDDVRQRALLKVMRGVSNMSADTPAGAVAWLRTVHRSAKMEHHRGLDPVSAGLKTERRDAKGRTEVERLVAGEPERSDDDRERLDRVIVAVLERVERWLDENVSRPSKRVGDRRRAECALMANVMGLEPDEIEERLGTGASRSALYKWIERGRESVLLPVLETWAAEAEDDPEGARVAEALREILEGSRRADAGKPRPGRRSVSRKDDTSSSPPRRPKGPRRS